MSKNTQLGNLVNGIYVDSTGKVGIGTQSPTSLVGYGGLTINGTSGGYACFNINGADAGRLITDSTNFYFDNISTGALVLRTTVFSTERMRITNAGNVGIGTSTPGGKLQMNNTSTQYAIYDSQGNFQVWQPETTASGTQVRLGSAYNLPGVYSNGQLNLNSDSGNAIAFHTSGATERMRITSSDGSLCIGTTSRAGAWGLLTLRNTVNAAGAKWGIGPDSADCLTIYNNSNIGVYMCSGATAWSANSDIRLKNIQSNITDALDSVNTLNAVKYTWKDDSTNTLNVGLIAQEVQAVLPEAVTVKNDEMKTLGVKYTEVIPLLVAAIQELSAEVQLLKNK